MDSYNRRLGIEPADGGNAVALEPGPEHQVMPGVVHFAVLTTLGEVAAAQAIDTAVVPANLAVSLLAPARLERLEARGRVLRRGRRLIFAEGEVTQGETLVAKVSVTFAVLEPR